jgi:hypothetical protein
MTTVKHARDQHQAVLGLHQKQDWELDILNFIVR